MHLPGLPHPGPHLEQDSNNSEDANPLAQHLMMKAKSTLLALAIGAPVLISFVLPRDTVSFAPGQGTSITKIFVTKGALELDDMSVLMNGEDPGDMMPEMEMQTTWTQTVTVTDEYLKMGRGQPALLSRSFDSIGQDMEVETSVDMMGSLEENDASGEGTSELEGKTVLFAWSEDDEEYTAKYPENESGDEELLEGLVEDMDLRMLLPDGDVSEGDEWELDLSRLATVIAPGGNLHVDIEIDGVDAAMGGPDPGMMSNLSELMGEIEGEGTAEYTGTREIDGITVAAVKVNIDINTARDMTEMMEDMMGDQLPEGIEVNFDRLDVEFTYEGEGLLLWNVEGGHVHSFEITGEVTMAMDMEVSMNMGEEFVIEFSIELSGEIGQEITTE